MKTKLSLLILLAAAIPVMAVPPCVTNCVLTINANITTELTPGRYGTVIEHPSNNVWTGTHLLWDDQPCETVKPDGATWLTVWVSGSQEVDTKIGTIHIDCINGKSGDADIIIPAYTSAAVYWFKYDCSNDANKTCQVRVCRVSQPDRAPNPPPQ